MNQVQKITVINKGAYVFNFSVQWLGANGKWVTSDWNSGNYAVNHSRTTPPLGSIGVPSDAIAVAVYGQALAGSSGQGTPFVRYLANGPIAIYEAVGTTLIGFAINFVGEKQAPLLPPGFPINIPVSQLPFNNWAQDIDVQEVWTCTPSSANDVVLICNWAKEQGYKVRATGIKHTWSPLTVMNGTPSDAKIILVDTTHALTHLAMIPASGNHGPRVRVATGATMEQLLTFLEYQPSGQGAASGYSFPHTPAPGHLTVGGVLAINGHGTATRMAPNDDLKASYGSMSNHILEFTAVVTDPQSPTPDQYTLRTFKRGEGDDKAFLTHLGRAFIVDVVLQVVDNYNLRCESHMDIPWQTLFQAPTADSPTPTNSFAEFMNRCGRIEVIWFPFSERPWLHLWTVAPQKPASSRQVNTPYNYPFADNVPVVVTRLLEDTLGSGGVLSHLTPEFGRLTADVTEKGLAGKDFLGLKVRPQSNDIWGSSKNTLLYIQDTTLRVTANGYAVHLRRADVQQAVHDFTSQFDSMLKRYQQMGQFPINSPMEIRVTDLDDPRYVAVDPGLKAESPVISSLSQDAEDVENQWEVALWLDVLTLPGTPTSNQFYRELEEWLVQRFSGSAGKVFPEWSKGWAYTDEGGAWTNTEFMERIRQNYTTGRNAHSNWEFEVETLKKYDRFGLFSNPLLERLFVVP